MSSKKPSEKRFRVPSSEDEEGMHAGVEEGNAMMKSILEKLKKLEKLDLLDQIHERLKKIETESKELKDTVAEIEIGLNSMKKDVEDAKMATEQKADKSKVEALEKEVEELRNRSRRNNLVFYNVPEKAEGDDCISFIQNFVSTHMGLETLCGWEVEIERAHRTPTKLRNDNGGKQRPRPIHVAFLRYADKMKVLSNAAARLKDNPLDGKLIGISEDFGKKTQEERKAIAPVKKYLQKKLGAGSKVFIAYPAILKCVDSNGKVKVIPEKELKRLKEEMEKDNESKHG